MTNSTEGGLVLQGAVIGTAVARGSQMYGVKQDAARGQGKESKRFTPCPPCRYRAAAMVKTGRAATPPIGASSQVAKKYGPNCQPQRTANQSLIRPPPSTAKSTRSTAKTVQGPDKFEDADRERRISELRRPPMYWLKKGRGTKSQKREKQLTESERKSRNDIALDKQKLLDRENGVESEAVPEISGPVHLRDVVLGDPRRYDSAGSSGSSINSDEPDVDDEERVTKMLRIFQSIQFAPDPDTEIQKKRRGRRTKGRRRGVVMPPKFDKPDLPREAVICIDSTSGQVETRFLGFKAEETNADENELENVSDVDLDVEDVPDIEPDDAPEIVLTEAELDEAPSPEPEVTKPRSSIVEYLKQLKENRRPKSAPGPSALKGGRRRARAKSATMRRDQIKITALDLKEVLPRRTFFSSHDMSLKDAGYDLASFKKKKPNVRFNKNIEIENIPKVTTPVPVEKEPEDVQPEPTASPTWTRWLKKPSSDSEKRSDSPSGSGMSIEMAAQVKAMARRARRKAKMNDDSLKVDRKLLVEYLTLVKEKPEEYATLAEAPREKVLKESEFNSLLKYGSIYRLTQQPERQTRSDTPIMKAIKGLVTRKFDASHIRKTLIGGSRMLRRRSSIMSISSVASSTASLSTAASVSEVNKNIPANASSLLRSKMKVERWLQTVTTSQLGKAKEAAIQELGEVNNATKWWELNKDCRYIRKPGTTIDPEPNFDIEDIVCVV